MKASFTVVAVSMIASPVCATNDGLKLNQIDDHMDVRIFNVSHEGPPLPRSANREGAGPSIPAPPLRRAPTLSSWTGSTARWAAPWSGDFAGTG